MHRLLDLLDRGQSKHGYSHIFVHSGQHFDYCLDGVFYRQLGVRRPDINFHVGRKVKKLKRGSHVEQSALMFVETAAMIKKVRPSAVLYLGDTNTVLTSLVVAKCGVPVIHIESGGRSYDWRMPEEKNRIVIDHLSDLNYCYLERYKRILLSEGIPEFRTLVVGNLIVDAIHKALEVSARTPMLKSLGIEANGYALCTLHREEHLENRELLWEKLVDLAKLARILPIVFPIMPRLEASVGRCGFRKLLTAPGLIRTAPLGFLDFLHLEKNARLIVTDSGTVQEEALVLGVPCLVTRRSTERPETIEAGATLLAEHDLFENALRALDMPTNWNRDALNPMGGSPSGRIFEDIVAKIHSGFFSHSREFEMLKSHGFAREAYGLSQAGERQRFASRRQHRSILSADDQTANPFSPGVPA